MVSDKNIKDRTSPKLPPYLIPVILVVSLFFLWGMANNLNDILIGQFKKIFSLSDFASGLVQSAFYFGYFVFAIPAALCVKNFGYKLGVILGLILYGAGAAMFYPAAHLQLYTFFLLALFVIASGLAWLETAANPLILAMGSPATATRRLNFAQAFNSLGVIFGVLIGKLFILPDLEHSTAELAAMSATEREALHAMELNAMRDLYLVLAGVVLFWALMVWCVRFPRVATESASPGRLGDYPLLFKNSYFMFGVFAQFCYVGAQVGIWSFMIRYGQGALPEASDRELADFLLGSLVAFMIGRFLAAGLMSRLQPAVLMLVFALVNIGLCGVAILSPNLMGILAMATTSFFMSLMFPTIFALSLEGLGERAKAGSALLIMSIIGGAILTAVMGAVSDMSSINIALIVPMAGFLAVALFSRASIKREPVAGRP